MLPCYRCSLANTDWRIWSTGPQDTLPAGCLPTQNAGAPHRRKRASSFFCSSMVHRGPAFKGSYFSSTFGFFFPCFFFNFLLFFNVLA